MAANRDTNPGFGGFGAGGGFGGGGFGAQGLALPGPNNANGASGGGKTDGLDSLYEDRKPVNSADFANKSPDPSSGGGSPLADHRQFEEVGQQVGGSSVVQHVKGEALDSWRQVVKSFLCTAHASTVCGSPPSDICMWQEEVHVVVV